MTDRRPWVRREAAPFAEAIEAIETILRMGFVGAARRTLSTAQWIERLDEDRRACPDVAVRYERAIERLRELEDSERLNGVGSSIDLNNRCVRKMMHYGRLSPDGIGALRVAPMATT